MSPGRTLRMERSGNGQANGSLTRLSSNALPVSSTTNLDEDFDKYVGEK